MAKKVYQPGEHYEYPLVIKKLLDTPLSIRRTAKLFTGTSLDTPTELSMNESAAWLPDLQNWM